MMMQQPDMIHCVDAPKLTVLERQRARLLKWQLEQGTPPLFQQQTQSYYNDAAGGSSSSFSLGIENSMGLGQVLNQCKMMNTSPGIEDWSPLGKIEVPCHAIGDGMGADSSLSYEASYGSISRTASCPPTVAMAAADGYVAVAVEKLSAPVGRDSLKKRKLETLQSIKGYVEDKRIRGFPDQTESKITEQSNNENSNVNNNMVAKNTNNSNKETCGSSSKDNSKASEVLKPDYIHVRARRGQATDSHSLAERVRREKISERMKFLQDLVPGCNKVTGKAGMLDEIINYVQSLQRQVEFLSMKLASVNSGLDFDIDTIFSNEMSPTCLTGFPMMIGNSSEPTNSTYLPFHPMQPLGSCSGGLDMGIMDGAISIQRPSTVPIPISEPLFDSSSFTQMQSTATAATWDSDFHNLYNMELQQARGTAATSAYQSNHQFIGSIDVTNMKMEI